VEQVLITSRSRPPQSESLKSSKCVSVQVAFHRDTAGSMSAGPGWARVGGVGLAPLTRTRSRSCSPARGGGGITRTCSRSHSPPAAGGGVRPARLREIVRNARTNPPGPPAAERIPIRYVKPLTADAPGPSSGTSPPQLHGRPMLRKSLSHSFVSRGSDSVEGRAGGMLQAQAQQRSEQPRGKLSVARSGHGVRHAPRGPGRPARAATSEEEAASDVKGALGTHLERSRFVMDKSSRIRDAMVRKLQRARHVLGAAGDDGDKDAGELDGDGLQRKETVQNVRSVDQFPARLSSLVLASGFATTITPCTRKTDTTSRPPACSESTINDDEHGMEMSDWKLDQILLEAHRVEKDSVDWGMVQKMLDRSDQSSRRLEGADDSCPLSHPGFCGSALPVPGRTCSRSHSPVARPEYSPNVGDLESDSLRLKSPRSLRSRLACVTVTEGDHFKRKEATETSSLRAPRKLLSPGGRCPGGPESSLTKTPDKGFGGRIFRGILWQ